VPLGYRESSGSAAHVTRACAAPGWQRCVPGGWVGGGSVGLLVGVSGRHCLERLDCGGGACDRGVGRRPVLWGVLGWHWSFGFDRVALGPVDG
jgi:hypothetical protein